MRNILLILLLPLFASCGAFQGMLQDRQSTRDVGEIRSKVDDVFSKVDSKLNQVQAEVGKTLDEAETRYKQAFEAADVNKDGKVEGWNEQMLLLLAGGGGLAEMLRRKLKGQDQKTADHAAEMADLNSRIDHERERRKDSVEEALRAQIELLRAQAQPKA